ncbi:MAG: dihydropteroate synthase [Marinifilaceae bacterium]
MITIEQINQGTPLVMGILNVTPDSFFDGGSYVSELEIIKRINQIVDEGADIIDVGAYSTRPGAAFVDTKEEIARILPAVELIRKYFPRMIISIDTFRAQVAKEVNECMGPVMINDISGGTMDPDMFAYVAKANIPYILMHIQGTPQTMQENPHYENVVEEVYTFFQERVEQLRAMDFNKIILDPGFGFGKTIEHNYQLMHGMERLNDLGLPLLVGISRKSMIYKLLNITPQESLNGTTMLNAVSLMKGAKILRVHDVKAAREAVTLYNALNGVYR